MMAYRANWGIVGVQLLTEKNIWCLFRGMLEHRYVLFASSPTIAVPSNDMDVPVLAHLFGGLVLVILISLLDRMGQGECRVFGVATLLVSNSSAFCDRLSLQSVPDVFLFSSDEQGRFAFFFIWYLGVCRPLR